MRQSTTSMLLLMVLAISIMLRPILAEAALWTPSSQHEQHMAMQAEAPQMMGEHCPSMMAQNANHQSLSAHHHHLAASYDLTPCDDCGEQCDCVKHLHLQTLNLPTLAPLVLYNNAQYPVNAYQPVLISAPSQNLERPPRAFNA
ncbi:hypothetical protein J3998_08145 [Thiomicrorhabdus sp. 6S2-11]|uniref:DUF2946 domain-containing protein n=1 Tax=Thiomicrorhabdus marina TaxID=2818442 RepID=A0ABS3Q664_9GAMM|nr:hypothetical protein [Thiomicrorhabdus marina]MBO1927548.1 hypothetical protein [Thiomicrorhabdus marina]